VEDLMDLSMILAAVVAALIAFSGYFLFNGLPGIGAGDGRARRSTRRS
jgi:hypothetical protein